MNKEDIKLMASLKIYLNDLIIQSKRRKIRENSSIK